MKETLKIVSPFNFLLVILNGNINWKLHIETVSKKLSDEVHNQNLKFCTLIYLEHSFVAWYTPHIFRLSLQRRHNEHNGVSNHRCLDYLLNGLFKRSSKKASKFHVTGFCVEHSLVTCESPYKAPETRNFFPFFYLMTSLCCAQRQWHDASEWPNILGPPVSLSFFRLQGSLHNHNIRQRDSDALRLNRVRIRNYWHVLWKLKRKLCTVLSAERWGL